jgi:hypothetical protein
VAAQKMSNAETQSLAPDLILSNNSVPEGHSVGFPGSLQDDYLSGIYYDKVVTQSTQFPNQLNHLDLSLDSNSLSGVEIPFVRLGRVFH